MWPSRCGALAIAAGALGACLTAPPSRALDGGPGGDDERVVAIGGGNDTFCAVTSAGAAYCWGDSFDDDGDVLPDDPTPYRVVDVDGAPVTDVVEVEAGDNSACARRATGEVLCWGVNGVGTLGDGTLISRPGAAPIAGGIVASAIAVGSEHACALSGSELLCWGDDLRGQVGDGCSAGDGTACQDAATCDGDTRAAEPRTVLSAGLPIAAVAVSASSDQTCAVTADGRVACAGANGLGQSGRTTATNCAEWNDATPVGLEGGGLVTEASHVAAATDHACAVSGGALVCWGSGTQGQLGNRGVMGSAYPVEVDLRGASTTSDADDVAACEVTALAGSRSHLCALCEEGRVLCWGDDAWGQLGLGVASTFKTYAVEVAVVADPVVDLAVGVAATCALRRDGAVLCWGRNNQGQLGDGEPVAAGNGSPLAVRVVGLPGG